MIDLGARLNFPNTHPLNLTGKNQRTDRQMPMSSWDWTSPISTARWCTQDPTTHATVPAIKPGCKVIHVTLADISMRGWTSDFQELAPVDLPIVANTKFFSRP